MVVCVRGGGKPLQVTDLDARGGPAVVRDPRYSAFARLDSRLRMSRSLRWIFGAVVDSVLRSASMGQQRVIYRHRVDPGRLHRHMRHAVVGQPSRALVQHPENVLKVRLMVLRRSGPSPGVRTATAMMSLPISTPAHGS